MCGPIGPIFLGPTGIQVSRLQKCPSAKRGGAYLNCEGEMSSPPMPSALDARTQAFPVLTEAQINRVRPGSKLRQVTKGEILFEPGDSRVPFFVLLSGSMEIVQPDLAGERPITTHRSGQFTGEMTMISGQRCLVRGRVTEPGDFLELSGDGLRSLVAKDAELSEIFMRAFILRRLALIRHGYGDLILLGSRHSANTLRLREFLTRNGHPHTYSISIRTRVRRNFWTASR